MMIRLLVSILVIVVSCSRHRADCNQLSALDHQSIGIQSSLTIGKETRIRRQSAIPTNVPTNRIKSGLDWKEDEVADSFDDLVRINRSNLITVLRSVEIEENAIKVTWRLRLIARNESLEKVIPKSRKVIQYLPTEWTLRVRQFGTLYVKLRFISEIIDYSSLLITGFKDINFMVTAIKDGTAYELCLQSKEFPVHDEIDTVLRRVSIMTSAQTQPEMENNFILDSKMVCKEVVTHRSECPSPMSPGKIATVTVVSSASTIIVVVVIGWCWCPRSKEKEKRGKPENGATCIEDDDESTNENEDKIENKGDEKPKVNWLKWLKLSASNNNFNSKQSSVSKSLMVNNDNYDKNVNKSVTSKRKVQRWLTQWRRSTRNEKSIVFTKDLETIDLNYSLNCSTSATIYRPKSWPQDEWTV